MKNGLVGEKPDAFQPVQGLVGHVLGEVILLVVRRFYRLRFSYKRGSHWESHQRGSRRK